MKTWDLPTVSDDELRVIERAILKAFDTRSTDGLEILGLGELGLALGWPTEKPTAVFKRQAVGPPDQLEADMARMHEFHDALTAAGAKLLPTDMRTITNDDGAMIPYMVQPVVERADLAEHIIAEVEPSSTHPVLVSLRDTVMAVVRDDNNGGLSLDAQITNFAWDGESVVSIDTTPPLIWEPEGGPMYEIGNYLTAVPWVLHGPAKKLTMQAGDDYRTARGVLEMTAVYLLRIDQERWVSSAIACFNEVLDEPLSRSDVDAKFARMIKDLPMIKRFARLQRLWATKVRKQRYEFFITNSFTGEIY